MNSVLWGAVSFAGAASLVTPFFLRPLLRRLKIFDVPTQRSSHTKPTLRGGGVATLLGFVLGGVWVSVALPSGTKLVFAVIFVAALLVSLVGLAEDLRGLRVAVRAGLQILIGGAVAVILSGCLGMSWIWVPVAAVGFAAHVNFTNFMDGVNGISSLQGFIAGLAFAALGVMQGVPWLATVGLLTASTFIAFLPWNLISPGMFLGDVGSYLLGGALGATSIAALAAGLHPVAALAPLSIYWADTVTTLFRRAARGEPVFEAHRTHAYQRLTNTGLSHASVAMTVAAFTSANGFVGLLIADSVIHWAVGGPIIIGITTAYLFLPRLRGDVLSAPATNEFPPLPLSLPASAKSDWIPTKWAVVGATGFIGRSTVEHLSQQGLEVRALSAPRVELDPELRDGEVVADLAESHPAAAVLARGLAGVDVVVNAAGMASPDNVADNKLFGANALLPAIIAVASAQSGVGRFVHLSSAAVQGDRPMLDVSPDVSPFSPYSRSKALGERAILAIAYRSGPDTDVSIIRATSVQGPGRPTTEALRRVARSPLASVAAPGDRPSVVSSVRGLVGSVHELGTATEGLAPIVLQPWEGLNVCEVLEFAGDRRPIVLPAWLCRTTIGVGKTLGRAMPRVAGLVRRVEIMWFGQAQEQSVLGPRSGSPDRTFVSKALRSEVSS